MRNRPIVIIGLPRSGSSMVAGLFAHHGVYAGKCKEADEHNAKGFFEHIGFTELAIELYGKGRVSSRTPIEPHPDFKERLLALIDAEGYTDGPWLIKHAPVYYKTWKDFNPQFVFVRRDTASISESAKECGWKSSTSHIAEGQKMITRLVEKYQAPQVMSNELVKGNYDSLRNALEYCSVTFDESIARDFIDPGLWRHSVDSLEGDNTVVMRDRSYLKPNLRKGQKHV